MVKLIVDGSELYLDDVENKDEFKEYVDDKVDKFSYLGNLALLWVKGKNKDGMDTYFNLKLAKTITVLE